MAGTDNINLIGREDGTENVIVVGRSSSSTTVGSGSTVKRVAVSSDYTVQAGDSVIAIVNSKNRPIITLQTAIGKDENTAIHIVDESGEAGKYPIRIRTTNQETISGCSDAEINQNYSSFSLYSDNANWFVR